MYSYLFWDQWLHVIESTIAHKTIVDIIYLCDYFKTNKDNLSKTKILYDA